MTDQPQPPQNGHTPQPATPPPTDPADGAGELERPDPWERQPDDTTASWEAFQIYRDQQRTQRSLRNVAKQLGRQLNVIGNWSSRYKWVRRVAEYDRHLDGERRRAREAKIIQVEERQVTQLAAAREALTQPVQALLARISEARSKGADPFAGMALPALQKLAVDCIRYMPRIVESERLVFGLSTENPADGAPASVEEMAERARNSSRAELEGFLVGVDAGRSSVLDELGIPQEERA